jgi:hypothetical protein
MIEWCHIWCFVYDVEYDCVNKYKPSKIKASFPSFTFTFYELVAEIIVTISPPNFTSNLKSYYLRRIEKHSGLLLYNLAISLSFCIWFHWKFFYLLDFFRIFLRFAYLTITVETEVNGTEKTHSTGHYAKFQPFRRPNNWIMPISCEFKKKMRKYLESMNKVECETQNQTFIN